MLSIAMLLIPIVFVVASGFCSAKYGLFDEKSVSVFTRFTFYVAMPCQLFKDFSILDLSQTINLNYMTAYGSAIAIMATTTFFMSRFLIRDSVAESAINVMGTSQVNTAYFAIPLFILVFDNAAPVFPIILIQVTALTMTVLLLIENDQTHESRNATGGAKAAWYKIAIIIAKNPIILASVSGIGFSYMGWHYPLPIEKFLSVMSGSTAPLALFALGQSLHYDIKRIERTERRIIIVICSGKLIAFPILAFCIGKFIFSLNDYWLSALLLMACMPSPKNMFIFSSKYGLNTKRANAVVATTTVLSFVSIYGVLYLMGGTL